MIVARQPTTATEIQLRWYEIEPILREATDRTGGAYEPIDYFAYALQGKIGFWLIEDGGTLIAIAVVEIRSTLRKKFLDITQVAGSRLEEWWAEFVTQMDEFAKRNECEAIIASSARPGWARFWKAHGVDARVAASVIIREVH